MSEKKKKTAQRAKTKAVVKKEDTKKELWAGATRLMGPPKDQKEALERELIIFAAKAAKISPFGINILGGLPYFNEMGAEEKAEQYSPGCKIQYNWIVRALGDVEKGICEARVVNKKEEPLCDWILGECSPASMKMGTLAGYQNHMAQTRAKNRAIKKTFGLRIHKDMMVEIGKMLDTGKVSELTASKIANASATSAEEIQIGKKDPKYVPVEMVERPEEKPKEPNKNAGGLMASEADIERIRVLAKKLKLENIRQMEKATGLSIDFKGMTKNVALKVLTELMQIKLSK